MRDSEYGVRRRDEKKIERGGNKYGVKEGRGEDRKRESGDEGKRGREDKIRWEESTEKRKKLFFPFPCRGGKSSEKALTFPFSASSAH